MTHQEYTLTVKKNITEQAGFPEDLVVYCVGDTMQVDSAVFHRLFSGESIKRHTRNGTMTFDKNNFENEVKVTTITVEYSTCRLGQRKSTK